MSNAAVIGIVCGVILHLILMFAAVLLVKVAWWKDIIDDDETALICSVFIPLGVMCFVGAIWLAETISDR